MSVRALEDWKGAGLGALLGAAQALGSPPLPRGRPPAWKAMESRGVIIEEVVIQVLPVFDTRKPTENVWFGRLANRIHVSTRAPVVRRALLFQEGSRVRSREIYESERILRALPFIKEAHIQLEPAGRDRARALVTVRDSWTLQVDGGYQKVGGQPSSNFGIQDQNFLGTGKTVGASLDKNPERTDTQFTYRDPQLLGSHWTLDGDYSMTTDGYGRRLWVRRPFFALRTPWSAALEGETRRSNLALYDQGGAILQTPWWKDSLRLASTWAVRLEEDRVWRAGASLTMDDVHYGTWSAQAPLGGFPVPPLEDRRQRGPAFTLDYQRDAFQSFQDIQGMDTSEDYNLAWGGSLEVGAFTRRLGSNRPGPFVKLHASRGWAGRPGSLTLFKGKLEALGGGAESGRLKLESSLSTYQQVSSRYGWAGYLGARAAHRPYPEDLLYVGGAEGLRGYPNYLHPGDRSWVFSMEHRFFTEQRWWGIFRLGTMVFLDAGSVHRVDGHGWSPVYPDVGIGLRLGDLKSSLAKVVNITLSTPLQRQPGRSGWQFGVENAVRF